MIVDFLVVDCPFAYNTVIGRSIIKALKAITFIYHLIMMFSIVDGARYVRGTQYDLRECYNKSV